MRPRAPALLVKFNANIQGRWLGGWGRGGWLGGAKRGPIVFFSLPFPFFSPFLFFFLFSLFRHQVDVSCPHMSRMSIFVYGPEHDVKCHIQASQT